MFTGIIETLGTIQEIKEQNNLHITVESAITD
jgi:riboflavin synthase